MKALEFLQGKWLGHPLHAALVHVPVGSWIAACLLDIVVFAGGWTSDTALRLALYCVIFGLLGAVVAIAPGFADWISIKPGKPAKKLGVYHMLLNFAAAAAWGTNLALRLASDLRVTPAVLATSVLGTLLLLASAYLGSLIVFDQGIGVARYSKKEWRQRALRGGARVPDEN